MFPYAGGSHRLLCEPAAEFSIQTPLSQHDHPTLTENIGEMMAREDFYRYRLNLGIFSLSITIWWTVFLPIMRMLGFAKDL
jgi:hypothetical protein